MIKIHPLADFPGYAPICAHWSFNQWYLKRDIPFDVLVKSYAARAQSTSVPLTYIAMIKTQPVAMASLKNDDLWNRKDLNPWLASLYVMPQYREQGIGDLLCANIIEKARTMGFDRIYLFLGKNEVFDLEMFYKKRGWKFLDRGTDNDGHPTMIYYFDIM